MDGISDEERQHLTDVVTRRIGARSTPDELEALVSGYLEAVVRNAFKRTTDPGPVPTSLTAERSALLIEVSSQMGKVIEDYEIQALLRVPLTQARTMRTGLMNRSVTPEFA